MYIERKKTTKHLKQGNGINIKTRTALHADQSPRQCSDAAHRLRPEKRKYC